MSDTAPAEDPGRRAPGMVNKEGLGDGSDGRVKARTLKAACLICGMDISSVFHTIAQICPACVTTMRCWRCGEPAGGLHPYLLCEPCISVVSLEDISWLDDPDNQPERRSWELVPLGKEQGR